MSSPGADAHPASPSPIAPGPAPVPRAPHLRAVQSPSTAPAPGAHSAYLIVLLIVGSGVAATAIEPSHWLRGVLIVGTGVGIGALARALLPSRYAGLLAVRGRPFDVICLGALAVLIVTVGLLIPH